MYIIDRTWLIFKFFKEFTTSCLKGKETKQKKNEQKVVVRNKKTWFIEPTNKETKLNIPLEFPVETAESWVDKKSFVGDSSSLLALSAWD